MTNLADIHTELHELNKNLKKLIEIQEMTFFSFEEGRSWIDLEKPSISFLGVGFRVTPEIWPRRATMLIRQNSDWFAMEMPPATQLVRRLPIAWQIGAAMQSSLLLKSSINAENSWKFICDGGFIVVISFLFV